MRHAIIKEMASRMRRIQSIILLGSAKVQQLRDAEQGKQSGKQKRKWKVTTACLQLNLIQERLQGKEKEPDFFKLV